MEDERPVLDSRNKKFFPPALVDIVVRLRAWAQEQNLPEKAMDQCRIDLPRCAAEKWENAERLAGRDLETIEIRFFRHTLMFQKAGLDLPHITTEFVLYFLPHDGSGPFGSYQYSVRLDGKFVAGLLTVFSEPALESDKDVF